MAGKEPLVHGVHGAPLSEIDHEDGDLDHPLETYAGSYRDVLNTFVAAGVRHELPDLFSSLVQEGVEAGLGKEQLTALTKALRTTS